MSGSNSKKVRCKKMNSLGEKDNRVSYLHVKGEDGELGSCFGGNDWAELVRFREGLLTIESSGVPDQLQGLVNEEYWKEFAAEAKEAAFVPAPCRAFGLYWLLCCSQVCLSSCHETNAKQALQDLVEKHRESMKKLGVKLEFFDEGYWECKCGECMHGLCVHVLTCGFGHSSGAAVCPAEKVEVFGIWLTVGEGSAGVPVEKEAPVSQVMEGQA